MNKLLRRGFFYTLPAVALLPLRAWAAELPVLWTVRNSSIYVDSSPAIGSNGVIYITTSGSAKYYDASGGKLEAIDPHGVEQWAFTTHVDIVSSPAIGADGTIYFGSRDRKIYAVSPNGKALWSYPTGAWVDASPAIGTNGTIYAGSWDGNFYALNPDGTKKWALATGGPIDSSAAIGTNGVIYFGSHDSNFYALNPDGSKQWTFATLGSIASSPAIGGDGTIVFTSVDGRLYELNPDGHEKWHLWTGGVSKASPVLDPAGNVYVGVNDMFFAITSGGTKKWSFGYPVIDGAAAVGADGNIYCGGTGMGVGALFAWAPADGTLNISQSVGGAMNGSVTMTADGTIYLGAETVACVALKANTRLARSSWPKFRGDTAQTGRAAPN